jgi:general secretion pathway protein D
VAVALAAGAARAETRLVAVEAARDASGALRVVLRTDGAPPEATPFALAAPRRLVLDLPGVANATGRERFEVGAGGVARVRLGGHAGFLRVVLDLDAAALAPRVEHDAVGIAFHFAGTAPSVVAERAARAGPSPQAQAPAQGPQAKAPARGPQAPLSAAEPAPAALVTIYGIELQAARADDRVLVFAEHELAGELHALDAATVELVLPNARLAESAARRLRPDVGGAIAGVIAYEPEGRREVRLRIERAPGAEPALTRRGAILAVEFPRTAAPPEGITLSFVDAELAEIVREVGKAAGTRFLFDDRLAGRATLSIVNRVSPAEAVEILHSALLSQGFAAVPAQGGGFRIVPVSDGKGLAPYRLGAVSDERAAPLTTLLRLRGAAAAELVATLERMGGTELLVRAFEPTNSVIFSGSEAAVRRYLAVAQALDAVEADEVAVVELQHRDAVEIAEILAQALPAESERAEGARPRFAVWADGRTNRVSMRAPAPQIAELRAWLEQLDRPPPSEGEIRVIRPLHANATRLAETLGKLAAGAPPAAPAREQTPGLRPSGDALAGRAFHVAVHESTGALLVQADAETHRLVREVVDAIDRRPPTIAVDVLVFEVTTTHSLALGLDAFLPWGDGSDPSERSAGAVAVQSKVGGVFQPVADPGAGFFRYARKPLLIPILGPGGVPTELVVPREIVQISAAEGELHAQTLLRPHLLALSGEEHELVAGDNVPVLVGALDAAGEPAVTDPLTIRNDIERRDVGTLLRVKPTAGQVGDVRLELEVEASRVRAISAEIADRIGPVIEQRKLSAIARLEPGQIAVLGMVLEGATLERDAGVPYLKDVPILGWLARSTVKEEAARTLVIAVQASIERTQEQRISDSVRHRLAFERTLARRNDLLHDQREGYALLVTTRTSEAEAEGVASALATPGAQGKPRIVPWRFSGAPRFDVYLTGFPTLRAAAAAADPLLAEGWKPELVALPPQAPPRRAVRAEE